MSIRQNIRGKLTIILLYIFLVTYPLFHSRLSSIFKFFSFDFQYIPPMYCSPFPFFSGKSPISKWDYTLVCSGSMGFMLNLMDTNTVPVNVYLPLREMGERVRCRYLVIVDYYILS